MSLPSSSISSSSMMPFMVSSMGRFFNSYASSLSLNIKSNLLSIASGTFYRLEGGSGGGGNTGSTAILKVVTTVVTYLRAFSTIVGISLAKWGELSSKHGFVLTSIIHGARSSSSMKS